MSDLAMAAILPLPDTVVQTFDIATVDANIHGFLSNNERSRPFNLLRGQLLKLRDEHDYRVIGITSATPRVGKSFVASNLAAALGRSPSLSTYLFDLDFRRASIGENFNLSVERGLTDFLDGTVGDLRDACRRAEDQRLTVFPTHGKSSGSAELLAGARMDQLFAAMRALPGEVLCLCDMPPVFANDDAVIISRKIDAYLLVIEEGVTTRKQLRDAVTMLNPAVCIGSVLNRYAGGIIRNDYGYGYGGSAYKKYYGDGE